jgi:hypothetical protein
MNSKIISILIIVSIAVNLSNAGGDSFTAHDMKLRNLHESALQQPITTTEGPTSAPSITKIVATVKPATTKKSSVPIPY